MTGGAEYPKALYRDGGPDLIWGKPVRTAIAADHNEEQALRGDGWRIHPLTPDNPLDHDGDGKPGGSEKPDADPDLPALREAYKAQKGKRAFPGWDAAEIRKRMA